MTERRQAVETGRVSSSPRPDPSGVARRCTPGSERCSDVLSRKPPERAAPVGSCDPAVPRCRHELPRNVRSSPLVLEPLGRAPADSRHGGPLGTDFAEPPAGSIRSAGPCGSPSWLAATLASSSAPDRPAHARPLPSPCPRHDSSIPRLATNARMARCADGGEPATDDGPGRRPRVGVPSARGGQPREPLLVDRADGANPEAHGRPAGRAPSASCAS